MYIQENIYFYSKSTLVSLTDISEGVHKMSFEYQLTYLVPVLSASFKKLQ